MYVLYCMYLHILTKHIIRTRGYYVPSATVRLFSPQRYLQQPENAGGNGMLTVTDYGVVFKFPWKRSRLMTVFDQLCINILLPILPSSLHPWINERGEECIMCCMMVT
jgi:hypothetical protein